MYEIILTTWYQETPDKNYTESYNNLEFNTIEKATNYLNFNIDAILDEYPVVELAIKIKK